MIETYEKSKLKEILQIHSTCCILGPFIRYYLFRDSFRVYSKKKTHLFETLKIIILLSHFFIYLNHFLLRLIVFFQWQLKQDFERFILRRKAMTCFYCRRWLATLQRETFWPIVNFIWNQCRLANNRKMAAGWNRLNWVVANFAFFEGVVGRELSDNRAKSLKQKSRL